MSVSSGSYRSRWLLWLLLSRLIVSGLNRCPLKPCLTLRPVDSEKDGQYRFLTNVQLRFGEWRLAKGQSAKSSRGYLLTINCGGTQNGSLNLSLWTAEGQNMKCWKIIHGFRMCRRPGVHSFRLMELPVWYSTKGYSTVTRANKWIIPYFAKYFSAHLRENLQVLTPNDAIALARGWPQTISGGKKKRVNHSRPLSGQWCQRPGLASTKVLKLLKSGHHSGSIRGKWHLSWSTSEWLA